MRIFFRVLLQYFYALFNLVAVYLYCFTDFDFAMRDLVFFLAVNALGYWGDKTDETMLAHNMKKSTKENSS